MKKTFLFLFFFTTAVFSQTKDSANQFNKSNATIIPAELIDKFPNRNINNILSFTSWISLYQDKIFMNGGRENEISYQLNGLPLTELMSGGTPISIPFEAIDHIEIGGMNPQLSYGHTDRINFILKNGTKKLTAAISAETDNISFQNSDIYNGNKNFGAYSYGYNYLTASFSGELFNNVSFYTLFNQKFIRDRTPLAIPELKENIQIQPSTYYKPIDFNFPPGINRNNSQRTNSLIGSFNFVKNNIQINLSAIYQSDEYYDGLTKSFENLFSTLRNSLHRQNTFTSSLIFKHLLSTDVSYEIGIGYSNYYADTIDPYLRDDFLHYSDTSYARRLGFDPTYVYNNFFFFSQPATTHRQYSKVSNEFFSLKSTFTFKNLLFDNLKVSLELNTQIFRLFYPYWEYIHFYYLSVIQSSEPEEGLLKYFRGGNVFGYDFKGNKLNENSILGPRYPFFLSLTIQDEITLKNFKAAFGLSAKYFNANNYLLNYENFEKTFDYYVVPDITKFTKSSGYFSIDPQAHLIYILDEKRNLNLDMSIITQIPRYSDIYEGLYSYTAIYYLHRNPPRASADLKPSKSYNLIFSYLEDVNEQFNIKLSGQIKYFEHIPILTSSWESHRIYAPINKGNTLIKNVTLSINYQLKPNILIMANSTINDTKGISLNYFNCLGNYVDDHHYVSTFQDVPLEAYPVFNANILFNYNSTDQMREIGLDNLSLSAAFQIHSGFRYSRTTSEITPTDPWMAARDEFEENLNNATTGWFFQIDIQLKKLIKITDNISSSIYIDIINLLDIKNNIKHFSTTGSASDAGHKNDEHYSYYIDYYGPDYEKFYALKEKYNSSFNYGPPRQIRLGIRMDF